MKGYWCISHNFGDYQLFIAKNKSDYKFIRKNTGYLGDKILANGRIEIEECDLINFTESKNPAISILTKAWEESRKTSKLDKKSLANKLKELNYQGLIQRASQ